MTRWLAPAVILATALTIAFGDGCSPDRPRASASPMAIYQSRRVTVWYKGEVTRPRMVVSVRPMPPRRHR